MADKKDQSDYEGQSRQKYKAVGLKEVRLWVPQEGEFLLQILAAQLRDGAFSKRPTDSQIERAKEIQKELSEAIPEKALLSKQAMTRWIKGHKGLLYDRRKEEDESLNKELISLGLDLATSKRATHLKKGRPKKPSRQRR